MLIACVLRSGGDFLPEHVERLRRMCAIHAPGVAFVTLADMDAPGRIPLRHGWPGWWSKMELFAPHVRGDLLYMDLDTTVIGSLADLLALDRLALISDFYKPEIANTGIMYLPEAERAAVWEAWIADPEGWMAKAGPYGDGFVLRETVGDKAARIQDALPGQVVSYKAHVMKATGHRYHHGDGTIPPGARVICFHGKPRPWEVM